MCENVLQNEKGSNRMKWTKHDKVSSFMTDPTANLSVMGIFQIAEEAVTAHMGELNIDGLTIRKEYGAVWVYTRNKVKIWKCIPWDREYTVSCFISKIALLSIWLDVEIRNDAGELCACSRAELCALDLQSASLRKVSAVGVEDSMLTDGPVSEIPFSRFNTKELSEVEQVRVGYTNIDFVGHTNNKEYIRFILNTYSVRELEERPVREIEIMYMGQSYENDMLTVCRGYFQDNDIVTIQKDDKTIIKCQVVRGSLE